MNFARTVAIALLASAPLAAQAPNTLTAAEAKGGWKLLFDGKSFTGWRGLGYDSVPSANWKIDAGAIQKVPSASVPRTADGKPTPGGDLLTLDTFANFELAFEWKVPPGANSGVKYNVSEELSAKGGSHAALGFEYQVLDDSLNDDNKIPSHRAGALYDLIAPNATKKLMPVGQWNKSRIIIRGKHGEHWLNGTIVVEFDMGTPYFDSLMAKSKYRSIPGFADHRAGHIVLQDHNEGAWFRNIKIREIKP